MNSRPTFNQRLDVLRAEIRTNSPQQNRVFTDRIARLVAEHMSLPDEAAMSDLPRPTPQIEPQLLVACHLAAILTWDLAETTIWRERFELPRSLGAKYSTEEEVQANLSEIEAVFGLIDSLLERIRSRYPLHVAPVQRLANG